MLSALPPPHAPPFGGARDWPMWGFDDDVRPTLRRLRTARQPCVLATLFRVDGGGPRPVGTQMVLAEGLAAGFFSGGCVEGDVALHAEEALRSGEPRTLTYGEGSPFSDIRLLCGARIDILLERLASDDAAVADLLALADARRPALWTSDGRRRRCEAIHSAAPGAPPLTATGQPVTITRHYDPATRLIVVGGDPTALAIASLGVQAGLQTILVRPKGPAAPPPIPGVAYSRDEARNAFAAIGLDRWTAVSVATHDLDADEPALAAALSSPAAYVGVLGARRRIPQRVQRLRALGVTEQDLARLRAPIGLPLGGKAPWEVAVSVIGEILQARQGVLEQAHG